MLINLTGPFSQYRAHRPATTIQTPAHVGRTLTMLPYSLCLSVLGLAGVTPFSTAVQSWRFVSSKCSARIGLGSCQYYSNYLANSLGHTNHPRGACNTHVGPHPRPVLVPVACSPSLLGSPPMRAFGSASVQVPRVPRCLQSTKRSRSCRAGGGMGACPWGGASALTEMSAGCCERLSASSTITHVHGTHHDLNLNLSRAQPSPAQHAYVLRKVTWSSRLRPCQPACAMGDSERHAAVTARNAPARKLTSHLRTPHIHPGCCTYTAPWLV